MDTLHVTFDRGTVRLSAPESLVTQLPGVLWDPRTACYRAPAYKLADVCATARQRGATLDGPGVRPPWRAVSARIPPLRGYQSDAVAAWRAFGRRGVVALPTGAGKTRVAVAALADAACPTAVLVPTCALLEQWMGELARWLDGPLGVLGDGENRVEPVTVMTFESAYRHLDRLGDRFRLLIVDEAHHFGVGLRAEALEASIAPYRLGLSATPPAPGSAAAARLDDLVGRVVCEVAIEELSGTHLAPLEIVQLTVRLEELERRAYEAARAPLVRLARAFRQAHGRAGEWQDLVSHLGKTREGRAAIAAWHRSRALASLPLAKRTSIGHLLDRHEERRSLVFTAFADEAHLVARDQLIPAVTADTSRLEREEILAAFRAGGLRALVSARVLNEGIDVPDADVAILAGGALGRRERLQRIGRVLRPVPGKTAIVYELTTADTTDDRRRAASEGA